MKGILRSRAVRASAALTFPDIMHKSRHQPTIACNECVDYNVGMQADERSSNTTLTIRNVDRALKEQLRRRAARHGHSMEAELRQVLREILAAERSTEVNLAEAIRRRFAPLGGVDLELHPPVLVRDPLSFGR